MKKLLVLAVLALGLCAAPAFATTISFADAVKVGDRYALPGGVGYFDGSGYFSNSVLTADGVTFALPSTKGGGVVFFYGQDGKRGLKGISSITLKIDPFELPLVFPWKGEGAQAYSLKYDYVRNADGSVTIDTSKAEFLNMIEMVNLYEGRPISLTMLSFTFGPAAHTPVPAAVWLLGTGVAGVAALRRKMK